MGRTAETTNGVLYVTTTNVESTAKRVRNAPMMVNLKLLSITSTSLENLLGGTAIKHVRAKTGLHK